MYIHIHIHKVKFFLNVPYVTESGGTAVFSPNFGGRWATAKSLYFEKNIGTPFEEARWALRPFCTCFGDKKITCLHRGSNPGPSSP
jgi:hypothetical protein